MKILASTLEALWQEAQSLAPLECCGVLWSESRHQPVSTFSSSPGPHFVGRFEFPDDWWLATLKAGRARRRHFAGVYHSHPRTNSLLPSDSDLLGHPEGILGLILGAGHRRAKLYRFSHEGFEEKEFQVVTRAPEGRKPFSSPGVS